MSPPRVTRRTRLWWPSVAMKPPRSTIIAYWTPVVMRYEVVGGWAMDHAPMSAIATSVAPPIPRTLGGRPVA